MGRKITYTTKTSKMLKIKADLLGKEWLAAAKRFAKNPTPANAEARDVAYDKIQPAYNAAALAGIKIED